jgi:hypothetical protein
LDSMVYFTSKSSSRVYRFKDNKTVGNTTDVVNCTIFVGNSGTLSTMVQELPVSNGEMVMITLLLIMKATFM